MVAPLSKRHQVVVSGSAPHGTPETMCSISSVVIAARGSPETSRHSGTGAGSYSAMRPCPFSTPTSALTTDLREKGVRLAQKTQLGPCVPVGMQP